MGCGASSATAARYKAWGEQHKRTLKASERQINAYAAAREELRERRRQAQKRLQGGAKAANVMGMLGKIQSEAAPSTVQYARDWTRRGGNAGLVTIAATTTGEVDFDDLASAIGRFLLRRLAQASV